MKLSMKLKVILLAVLSVAVFAFGDIVFYGATKVTVPTATAIDLKTNAMYRIFARCDYDGDISHKITMVSGTTGNNWTVIPSGTEQKIKYSVENSKGETKTIEVSVIMSGSLIKIERTVYTLPKANIDAIQIAGTKRGDNQDRQHLGIFMPRNAKFNLEWKNYGDFVFPGGLKVKMYQGHADGNVSGNTNASGLLQNFTHNTTNDTKGSGTNGGIPFIITPMIDGDKLPLVEITINPSDASACKTLNYYHYKDDRNTFWNGWVNDKYALIGGRSVQLMMPVGDKTLFGTILDNDKIDKLLEFYDDFYDMFNRFHGLDINSANLTHKNVITKFFMAPQYGGCCPFYGWDNACGMVAGSNDPSLLGYLRAPGTIGNGDSEGNWVSLHEAGHGYDGEFSRSKEVEIVDVTNNVMGSLHQSKYCDFTTAEGRKKSWLWDYNTDLGADHTGAFNTLDLRAKNVRKGELGYYATNSDNSEAGKNPTYHNLREKMYILVMMYRGAGKDIGDAEKAHAAVRKLDREMYAKGTPWTMGSLLAKGFADGSKTNIVPFLDAYGFGPYITDMVRAQAYENDNQIAFFLDSVAPSTMGAIKTTEKLWGATELIKPAGRSAGTGKISLNIDDFSLVEGKTLKIRNGTTIVDEIEITSQTLTTKSLPIGVYFIEMPLPKGNPGIYLTGYNNLIIVENKETPVSIVYKKPEGSSVSGAMRIDLLGGSDKLVYQIKYDALVGKLVVYTAGGEPHWVNNGPTYMTIDVSNGKKTFQCGWTTKNKGAVDYIDVKIGDEIKVTHAEGSSRLRAMNSITNLQDKTNYTFGNNQQAILEVTQYGIFQKGTSVETQKTIYTANFNAMFEDAKANNLPWNNPNAYQDLKTSLIYASTLLSAADKKTFDDEFNALLNGTGPEPTAPTITTTSLSNATLATAYSQTLTANGTNPITWAISGNLPTGLTLNSATGVISGTPTAAGTSVFTATATNSLGSNDKQLSITVEIFDICAGKKTFESLDMFDVMVPGGFLEVTYNGKLWKNKDTGTKHGTFNEEQWEEIGICGGPTPIVDKKEMQKYGIKFVKNPTTETAEINVSTPETAKIEIVIYDNTGNIVFRRGGISSALVWDLRNTAGRFVANGTYLVIVKAIGQSGNEYHYSAKLGVKR